VKRNLAAEKKLKQCPQVCTRYTYIYQAMLSILGNTMCVANFVAEVKKLACSSLSLPLQ
jgi:hypothetical protein